MKTLNTQCVKEEDDEYLDTSYGRANRLRPLAVTNKHAMLRGVPYLEEEEARTITRAILAMKGIHQRKHRAAYEEGILRLLPKPLSYQGSTHAWTRNLNFNNLETWTRGDHEEAVQHIQKLYLKVAESPCCKKMQDVSKLKLKTGDTFSQLSCTTCGEVSSTMKWRCPCSLPWYKCAMHVQLNLRHESSHGAKGRHKNKACNRGVDEPMPKVRRVGNAVGDMTADPASFRFIPLQPGLCPLLSNRFPHQTRREGGVTTPCPDGCPDQRG